MSSVALQNRHLVQLSPKGRSEMTTSLSTRRRSSLRQQPTRAADRSRTIAAASGTVMPLRRADAEYATAGESAPSEAQKPADENAQAARLDRLGWWNVLNTMEPFTRLFTDNRLAKLDRALTEHPDECPLEDMKRFAIEYRDGAARLAAVLLAHVKTRRLAPPQLDAPSST